MLCRGCVLRPLQSRPATSRSMCSLFAPQAVVCDPDGVGARLLTSAVVDRSLSLLQLPSLPPDALATSVAAKRFLLTLAALHAPSASSFDVPSAPTALCLSLQPADGDAGPEIVVAGEGDALAAPLPPAGLFPATGGAAGGANDALDALARCPGARASFRAAAGAQQQLHRLAAAAAAAQLLQAVCSLAASRRAAGRLDADGSGEEEDGLEVAFDSVATAAIENVWHLIDRSCLSLRNVCCTLPS